MSIFDRALTLLVISLFSSVSRAGFLSGPEMLIEFKPALDSFVHPNEVYPQDAKAIWAQSPPGVYVSVGTERGFMGAAFSNQATHLFLLDNNPLAVNFNRINILLLKIAENREDYLRLRTKATREDWLAAAQKAKLNEASIQSLQMSQTFEFWETHVRNTYKFEDFHSQALSSKAKFGNVNYLMSDELFSRIQKMAKEDRIDAQKIDLGKDFRVINENIQKLKKMGVKLGTLDLSNAWWSTYLSPEHGERLLKDFEEISLPKSIVLITQIIPKNANPGRGKTWSYRGFTFDYIKASSPSYTQFLEQMEPTEAWSEREENNRLYDLEKPLGANSCTSRILDAVLGGAR